MTALTQRQRTRLRNLVEGAYTQTTMSRGGVPRRKKPKQWEIERCVAHAVVDFAADHVTDEYLAPAGLWSELMDELIERGVLVQHETLGLVGYTDVGTLLKEA
jgi:hypothetical protein